MAYYAPPRYSIGYSQPNYAQYRNPGESTAIAGFVCSIVGLFVPLFGILGFILSLVSHRNSKRAGWPNSGLAIAGMVIGAIGGLFTTLLTIGVLGAALWHTGYTTQTVNSVVTIVETLTP